MQSERNVGENEATIPMSGFANPIVCRLCLFIHFIWSLDAVIEFVEWHSSQQAIDWEWNYMPKVRVRKEIQERKKNRLFSVFNGKIPGESCGGSDPVLCFIIIIIMIIDFWLVWRSHAHIGL